MEGMSPYVFQKIIAGEAVLFLGAGASVPSTGKNNTKGLTGNQLRDKLSDKFLGGESKSKLLNYVADRSMTVAGMGPVHRYLKELMGDLMPTPGHLLIPRFRWHSIVTTNYDFLTERAYEKAEEPMQTLERIIWDRDDFGSVTSNPDAVGYIKLHGCLNRINDPELPLVLSSHDYYKFKVNRSSLVSNLREWGVSNPIIFCGYSIADENIKEILFDLTDSFRARPQYVIVDPYLEKGDIDYWKANRFDCFQLSFDEFMKNLSDSIPSENITLGKILKTSTSISINIPSHARPTSGLTRYLDNELTHVHESIVTDLMPPQEFYRGNSNGFAWISENYDVRRRVLDTLIADLVLDSGKMALAKPFFYILSGYAGSGKSVALKRFSREAAVEYGLPVFYLGPGATLRIDEISELSMLIESRIIVVIDDALVNHIELQKLIAISKKKRMAITFLGGARSNEWNMHGTSLEADLDAEYELLDLNKPEVERLIAKLKDNRCLGYLEHLNNDERLNYFQEKLKSQLLVALHEATEGKSFVEIVSDEYQRITPDEARLLYLDVCTLSRFDVGMRAGLMSRISGVTFDDFSNRLLNPLEHVIFVHFDHRARDYIYRARHQNIAELVFDSVLDTQTARADQIVRILKYLNGAYEADRIALQLLVKGRTLAGQFSDRSFASQIFTAALESGLHESIVDHQRAVFELHHPHGDLRAALALINNIEQRPKNLSGKTISHTKANIFRRLASSAKTDLERTRYRQDALSILNISTRTARDALPFFTKGQLLLEQLQERMVLSDGKSEEEVDASVVTEITKDIESTLRQGLQNFPEDEKLLGLEADLSKFLNNTPRALRALERAYSTNKQSVYTVIRLSRHYMQSTADQPKAIAMMRKLTSEQPLSKEAHFEIARMLAIEDEEKNLSEIGHHLKRSFSAGDSHFEARFLYARHQFLHGNQGIAKQEYSLLAKIPLNPTAIQQVRAEIKDNYGNSVWHDGVIASIHESFAFIRSSYFQDNMFMHFRSMTSNEDWLMLMPGSKVRFTVGFSYKGPRAKKVTLQKDVFRIKQ